MSVTNYFTVIKFFTRFTANVSEVVVVPRLELEVNLEDVNATVESTPKLEYCVVFRSFGILVI